MMRGRTPRVVGKESGVVGVLGFESGVPTKDSSQAESRSVPP